MPNHFNFQDYNDYYNADFRERWLRPEMLYSKLNEFKERKSLEINVAGKSLENRDIYKVEWGHGPVSILMWSQMHGNEPTATMALMDLLSFLSSDNQEYALYRDYLSRQLQITIIPMLNPDGAERFTRRNAAKIDINRDALSKQSPEGELLIHLSEGLKPHWAFNLHDQRNMFSVASSGKPATVSFLAPSYNHSRSVNTNRENAMRLIAGINDRIEDVLGGHSARFSDEYYPRAMGEYFQRQEIPCVLIESGAYFSDPYRDTARKLNFIAFLSAFDLIARETYLDFEKQAYLRIPENDKGMLDLKINSCIAQVGGKKVHVDLGLMREEVPDIQSGTLKEKWTLRDMGDLSTYGAMEKQKGGEIISELEDLQVEKLAHFTLRKSNGSEVVFKDGIAKS